MQTISAMVEHEFLRCGQVVTFPYAHEYRIAIEHRGEVLEGVGASPQLAQQDLRQKFYAHLGLHP